MAHAFPFPPIIRTFRCYPFFFFLCHHLSRPFPSPSPPSNPASVSLRAQNSCNASRTRAVNPLGDFLHPFRSGALVSLRICLRRISATSHFAGGESFFLLPSTLLGPAKRPRVDHKLDRPADRQRRRHTQRIAQDFKRIGFFCLTLPSRFDSGVAIRPRTALRPNPQRQLLGTRFLLVASEQKHLRRRPVIQAIRAATSVSISSLHPLHIARTPKLSSPCPCILIAWAACPRPPTRAASTSSSTRSVPSLRLSCVRATALSIRVCVCPLALFREPTTLTTNHSIRPGQRDATRPRKSL